MKLIARSALVGLSLVSMMAAISVASAQKPVAKKPMMATYASVDKIIQAHCVSCHHGATPAARIDLSSYASVMKATFKGKPVVVAKNAKGSVLVDAVMGHGVEKMPPGPALPAASIKTISDWITAGAKK